MTLLFFYRETLIRLEMVLDRLIDAVLKLKPSEFIFCKFVVPFLGHVTVNI